MSWLFFFLFLSMIIVIIEISALILESTGLVKEVARFQAISLLTGTGYTTTEAELITKHPLRRRVAQFLAIFGNVSFAIIIAVFINFTNQDFIYSQIMIGIVILSITFLFFRFGWLQRQMKKRMGLNLGKLMSLEDAFYMNADEIVLEFTLLARHSHLFQSLRQLDLANQYDIHILTIKRGEVDGQSSKLELIKHPTGSTVLQEGDTLLLFGNKENIARLFNIF